MREVRQQTTVSTSIDPDLVTRTSWVDAYTAYIQITRVCMHCFNVRDRRLLLCEFARLNGRLTPVSWEQLGVISRRLFHGFSQMISCCECEQLSRYNRTPYQQTHRTPDQIQVRRVTLNTASDYRPLSDYRPTI